VVALLGGIANDLECICAAEAPLGRSRFCSNEEMEMAVGEQLQMQEL
jgi:hypothetical protein